MRNLVIVCSLFLITACASTFQAVSISEAYKKYEAREYENTLALISRAENLKETTPEQQAELTYLKAQSYEHLGQTTIAVTLYKYLKNQHANSQYGYLASKKLASLD